jgi:hypothetical protein
MASFWDTMGPGLLQIGGNAFLGSRASKEAEERLRRAQGPLYDTQQTMAGKSLALAGSMDPTAMAADRFAQQQALVAPGNEAARLALMRELQSKGMLGTASYAPVAGTVNTTGAPMNPQMAALLAAQEGAKAQASYGSLKEGNDYLTQLLGNSGMLQRQAQDARTSGIRAQFGDRYTGLPAKPSLSEQVIKGGLNLLKDPKARDAVMGAVKGIPGMLGSVNKWLFPAGDYSGNYMDF